MNVDHPQSELKETFSWMLQDNYSLHIILYLEEFI
jgi:hypothetical protein